MPERFPKTPRLRYEPRLVREAISPLLHGLARLRYRAEAEVLYAKRPPDRREQEFAALDLRTFQALGLHDVFEAALRDAGPMPDVEDVRVFVARDRSEEGADLAPCRAVALLRILPARVRGDARALQAFLLHEFTHLVDLLDPKFAYVLEAPAPGQNRARADLVRDRYRALWNASVDGRLSRRGEALPETGAARRGEVRRAFAALGEAEAERLFEEAWRGALRRHPELLAAARTGVTRGGRGLAAGGVCPACGFPAWEVARTEELAAVSAAVHDYEPGWEPEDGLCARCLEYYRLRRVEETAWR